MVKLISIITRVKLAHLRGQGHFSMSNRQRKYKDPISSESGAAIVRFKTAVFEIIKNFQQN